MFANRTNGYKMVSINCLQNDRPSLGLMSDMNGCALNWIPTSDNYFALLIAKLYSINGSMNEWMNEKRHEDVTRGKIAPVSGQKKLRG